MRFQKASIFLALLLVLSNFVASTHAVEHPFHDDGDVSCALAVGQQPAKALLPSCSVFSAQISFSSIVPAFTCQHFESLEACHFLARAPPLA